MDGKPFVALWKSEGQVISAESLDDSLKIAENTMFSQDISYEGEVVGKVFLYYTDQLLMEQVKNSEDKLNASIEALSATKTQLISPRNRQEVLFQISKN